MAVENGANSKLCPTRKDINNLNILFKSHTSPRTRLSISLCSYKKQTASLRNASKIFEINHVVFVVVLLENLLLLSLLVVKCYECIESSVI